ncbi:MAG TPA: amidohydrolase family protein [Vicinamibacterales bacterium]|nr:amidohydrolase family protein [Vicinamibacterales bacterium]
MFFSLLLVLLLALAAGPGAQTTPSATRIQLFLIERPVGFETATSVTTRDGHSLTSEVELVDRGTRLQLSASLETWGDGTARHFRAAGKSYRFVNVDAEVTAAGTRARVMSMGETSEVALPPAWFPARSWAPVAARAALIDYWEKHKRPAGIALLPGDADSRIVVTFRGDEEIQVGGKAVKLRRYSVDGVVWGRETVWVDAQGAFAALVTRIHILPFEAVREDLASALPALQASSVRDRMTDLAGFASVTTPMASGAYALSGARLITGDDVPAIDDGVVIVRDGRIAAVGPRSSVQLPQGMRVIDLKGATIIPGLIDMHAHASQIEWAPAYLAAGVTTFRDMGGEAAFLAAFRNEIASGRGLGPRVELAGLVDGPGDGGFGTVVASTPAEGRAVVDRYHALGFSQMKLYSLVQPDVVAAITGRAHELKMPVTGHVPTALGLEKAVLAGMDQVAHLSVRGQPGTPDTDRVIALLADRHVVIDPTQAWGEITGRPRDVRPETFEPGIAQAPYPLAANYRSVLNNPRPAPTPPPAGTPATPATPRGSILKVLHDKGVPIVAGTDGALPGFSLLREVELYVQAGFTPLQAIQAATSVSARALNLGNTIGTIAIGKRADLVALDADPLANISAIRRTRFVVTNGKMYDPGALWRLAGFRPAGK